MPRVAEFGTYPLLYRSAQSSLIPIGFGQPLRGARLVHVAQLHLIPPKRSQGRRWRPWRTGDLQWAAQAPACTVRDVVPSTVSAPDDNVNTSGGEITKLYRHGTILRRNPGIAETQTGTKAGTTGIFRGVFGSTKPRISQSTYEHTFGSTEPNLGFFALFAGLGLRAFGRFWWRLWPRLGLCRRASSRLGDLLDVRRVLVVGHVLRWQTGNERYRRQEGSDHRPELASVARDEESLCNRAQLVVRADRLHHCVACLRPPLRRP